MNWEAIGAIGEIVGAIAVVATLFFLVIQIRQNTHVMEESNRLERVAAIDRHAETIQRWRGSLAKHGDLAEIWLKAINDEDISNVEGVRLNNAFISFINTQRSNFERAHVVGELGLAQQATKSIAVECNQSHTLLSLWNNTKNWHKLASPEFVAQVDKEMEIFASNETEFRSAIGPSSLLGWHSGSAKAE